MKKSLKYLLLCFLLPICFSCSNDDDTVTTEISFEEKIVGTWQLTDREPYGIEYCELSNTIQFSQEETISIEASIGDEPGNCQSFSRSGTWAYLGNNEIEVDIAGTEENEIIKIEFFDKNTGIKLSQDSSEVVEIYVKQ